VIDAARLRDAVRDDIRRAVDELVRR
jgi:hypothetical protein